MGSGAGKSQVYAPSKLDHEAKDEMTDKVITKEALSKTERTSSRTSQSSSGRPSLVTTMLQATSFNTAFRKTEEFKEQQEFQPHVDFLRIVASPSTDLETYVNTIITEVVRLLNAERCSVFFVDDVRKEVCCVGAVGVEPFRMPWDRGIVGASARRGQVMNIQDAHSHQLFDTAVERATGYVVNTILSLPIKHMIDSTRSVGVLQVLNKCGGSDAAFSSHDEKELGKLAMVIADSFYRQRWRALESGPQDNAALAVIAAHSSRPRLELQGGCRKFGQGAAFRRSFTEATGALQHFCKPEVRSTSFVSESSGAAEPQKEESRNNLVSGKSLSFMQDEDSIEVSPLGEKSIATVVAVQDCAASIPPEPVQDCAAHIPPERWRGLGFNPFDYQADDLVPLVGQIMTESRLTEQCAVSPDYLRNWSWACRRLYKDNPYHNWYHGFSVFQHCYYQLLTANIFGHLRYLDVFGLLVAALCHDVDHPGVTNGFLVEEGNELALRYNDQSVLENHHAHLACELLRKDETAIGSGLPRSEQQCLRRIIIRSILDTDMIRHTDQCQAMLSRLGADNTQADRQFWLSSAIHTADLAGQALPWSVAHQWEERVSTEFLQQANQELELGRTPAPFMQFQMGDLQQRGKLQRNFIDFVLVPLWDAYTQLNPQLRRCFDNLLENREFYDKRANTAPPESEEEQKEVGFFSEK